MRSKSKIQDFKNFQIWLYLWYQRVPKSTILVWG